MINHNSENYHGLGDEWLVEYAAGGLSYAKRFMIACQAALKSDLRQRLQFADEFGATFVESAPAQELSDQFFDQLGRQIDDNPAQSNRTQSNHSKPTDDANEFAWAPQPLIELIAAMGDQFSWKNTGGVQRATLGEFDGDRLYLLKSKPGLKLPKHSHSGEEWALVLHGGYHANGVAYKPGDLHCENSSCTHQPIIDDHDDGCISLITDEGKLQFSNPLMRAIQPFIGI